MNWMSWFRDVIPRAPKPADRGPWTQTRSGAKYYALDPKPEEINIEDCGTFVNRWGGACGIYGTTEHQIRCARLVASWGFGPWIQYQAATHDAHEFGCGDIPGPWLRTDHPSANAWRNLERKACAAVRPRLGLPRHLHPAVKDADRVLLTTEARDLLPDGPCDEWTRGLPDPMAETIVPMAHEDAERQWWALVGRLALTCAEHHGGDIVSRTMRSGQAAAAEEWEQIMVLREVGAVARRMVDRLRKPVVPEVCAGLLAYVDGDRASIGRVAVVGAATVIVKLDPGVSITRDEDQTATCSLDVSALRSA